jgi:4-amino-4-deoxy-L-arabinose transferase-like glycosyltransferase
MAANPRRAHEKNRHAAPGPRICARISTMPIAENPAPWRRDLLLLGLLFAVLFGFRLGCTPLANPDEGRYAEIPREMVASGDWVTPRLDGVNYFEKPPLMYWAVAACTVAFGPSEWSMRAGPALFALGGVLLTYAAARRLYGRRAGLAAAAVLGTSLLYFALGRILLLDMAVSVLMSAALFCFILGVREPPGPRRRWLFYGLYASMALATLTKGLIGFLVTGAVMFVWLLVFKQWKRLRPLHLPTGALLFLAIAGPWHVLAALHNPTWAHRYFVYEHWERFTTTVADRVEPWWYFAPIALLGLFPWTGFLWPAVREVTRGGWAARTQKADTWFFVTWAVFIFLFFSASESKLIPYILPIFPPLAVLIGASLAPAVTAGPVRLRAGLGGFSFMCGLLAVALLVVSLKAGIVRDAEQAQALRPFGLALAAILLAGGIFTPWFAKRRGPPAALAGIGLTTVMFLGVLTGAAPNIQKPGTKALALYVKTHAGPGDRVVHYHDFFQDFLFYAQREVDVTGTKSELELEEDPAARASGRFYDEAEFRRRWAGPQRLWVVARRRDVKELFADPTFRYHLLGESRNHYLFSNQP